MHPVGFQCQFRFSANEFPESFTQNGLYSRLYKLLLKEDVSVIIAKIQNAIGTRFLKIYHWENIPEMFICSHLKNPIQNFVHKLEPSSTAL